MQSGGPSETFLSKRQHFQERAIQLRRALERVVDGELGGTLDARGLFICSKCGRPGLYLDQVVQHEAECCGAAPAAGRPSEPAADASRPAAPVANIDTTALGDFASQLAAAFGELRSEIIVGAGAPSEVDGAEEDPFRICVDRLRDVVENAAFRDEKKYRRIRLSNTAFHAAIGRWPTALRILEVVGFECIVCAAKREAEPEPHLVLPTRLPENRLQAVIKTFSGEPQPEECELKPGGVGGAPPADGNAMVQSVVAPEMDGDGNQAAQIGNASLEKCSFCDRYFRFDRVAKHETRCRASKPKPKPFDVVRDLLQGTPCESYIPEVRAEWQNGRFRLPPLKRQEKTENDECLRCGCRFGQEQLERHVKNCRGAAQRRSAPGGVRGAVSSSWRGQLSSVSNSSSSSSAPQFQIATGDGVAVPPANVQRISSKDVAPSTLTMQPPASVGHNSASPIMSDERRSSKDGPSTQRPPVAMGDGASPRQRSTNKAVSSSNSVATSASTSDVPRKVRASVPSDCSTCSGASVATGSSSSSSSRPRSGGSGSRSGSRHASFAGGGSTPAPGDAQSALNFAARPRSSGKPSPSTRPRSASRAGSIGSSTRPPSRPSSRQASTREQAVLAPVGAQVGKETAYPTNAQSQRSAKSPVRRSNGLAVPRAGSVDSCTLGAGKGLRAQSSVVSLQTKHPPRDAQVDQQLLGASTSPKLTPSRSPTPTAVRSGRTQEPSQLASAIQRDLATPGAPAHPPLPPASKTATGYLPSIAASRRVPSGYGGTTEPLASHPPQPAMHASSAMSSQSVAASRSQHGVASSPTRPPSPAMPREAALPRNAPANAPCAGAGPPTNAVGFGPPSRAQGEVTAYARLEDNEAVEKCPLLRPPNKLVPGPTRYEDLEVDVEDFFAGDE